MSSFNQDQRMNGLKYLITRGVVRTASEFRVVKPLLQAMCLKREVDAKFKGQGNNMGNYVKDSEFVSLNGQCLNECMTPHDVALMILVIENHMTTSDMVSKSVYSNVILLHYK